MRRLPQLGAFAPLLLAAACVVPAPDRYREGEAYRSPVVVPQLEHGQTLAQGMAGVSFYTEIDRSGGLSPTTSDHADSLEQVPTIGGAFQHALWGEQIDAGLEVGGMLGFRTAGGFVHSSGGSLIIHVDIDMTLLDIFGGPFVSVPLGDEARIYAAAGPLVQFANWSQRGQGVDQSSTGFGTGYYARTGFEFLLNESLLLGVGVRWYESRVTLGGELGDLDLQGTQSMITFTTGF